MSGPFREVDPFFFHASRAGKELPYATVPRVERDKEYYDRKDLKRDFESSDAFDWDEGSNSKRTHVFCDSESTQIDSDFVLSQCTSDFDYASQQRPTALIPSSPPVRCDPPSSPGHDDSGYFETSLRASFTVSETESEAQAKRIIDSAISEGTSTVRLSGLELTAVPDLIADLKHLVCADEGFLEPRIQLYLDTNRLTTVQPKLFEVTNISVLTLRNNQLESVPPAIRKLTRLAELSLSRNNLRYLPCEILDLPCLQVFSVFPNEFYESDAYTERKKENCENDRHTPHRVVYELHEEGTSRKSVQTLLEACQVKVGALAAEGSVPNRDRRLWSERVKQLVEAAEEYALNDVRCGMCSRRMINGAGYALEWWDNVHGQSGVVFKRPFCSPNCLQRYE
ncbi:hypothetical protein TRVA0_018S00276 [Trichomonascus vanleenenianus]|uniref:leucine-rich repeat domain-containing protein n=1 Tax=Trichomonascus vanleenenianus TaxID=2268995 RepID=UPI003EC99A59